MQRFVGVFSIFKVCKIHRKVIIFPEKILFKPQKESFIPINNHLTQHVFFSRPWFKFGLDHTSETETGFEGALIIRASVWGRLFNLHNCDDNVSQPSSGWNYDNMDTADFAHVTLSPKSMLGHPPKGMARFKKQRFCLFIPSVLYLFVSLLCVLWLFLMFYLHTGAQTEVSNNVSQHVLRNPITSGTKKNKKETRLAFL